MKFYELNNRLDIQSLLYKLDVTEAGIQILANKSRMLYFYIQELRTPGANILKQDALSVGADLAVPKGTICCESSHVNGLLMGTPAQFKALSKKLKAQPFGLKTLVQALDKASFPKESIKPKIMGIVNANDDSFFKGSRFQDSAAIKHIESMIANGAKMIDLGGVSSRPGSQKVSADVELARIKPIIDAIYSQKLYEKAIFSLDSYAPMCIEYALEKGFGFINDITGLRDEAVAKLGAQFGVPVCIMHMQGSPRIMQEKPIYEDVIAEVDIFFATQLEKAKSFGIKEVVLDVGIGFGKTLEHNLLLLKHLGHFLHHGCELLIGASRKSMINLITPTPIEERLPGTIALHLEAVRQGARIVRVHDVKEHFQALEVAWAIEKTLLQGAYNE
jgi:dihydropteroate synthase